MPDMQVAVRLGRKPGDDRLVATGGEVGADDIADEILTRIPCHCVGSRHDLIAFVRPAKFFASPD